MGQNKAAQPSQAANVSLLESHVEAATYQRAKPAVWRWLAVAVQSVVYHQSMMKVMS